MKLIPYLLWAINTKHQYKLKLSFKLISRFNVIILILLLGNGINVSSAGQDNGRKQKVQEIIALNKSELAEPEGMPLNMPTDVAVGPEGDIYVLDGVNNRIVVYDIEGNFNFQFGSSGSEPGYFSFPLGITLASDEKVYIADSGNHRIQVFEPNGIFLEAVNLPIDKSNILPDPTDLIVDSVRNRLYIVDNENHHILVYNLVAQRFEAAWGNPGQGELQFRYPFFIDVSNDGYLFIVEPINTRVQVLNPNGKFVNFIGAWGVKSGQLFRPKGVAIYQDKVFVSDSYLGRIEVFDIRGNFINVLNNKEGTQLKFDAPTGIAIDSKRKRLYIVELKANRVCRLDLE